MARVRPLEHRAIVAMLTEPADSVEDLATDVIQKIDAMRAERTDYLLLVQESDGFIHAYGGYVTKNAAYKDIGKSVFAVNKDGKAVYTVLPLGTSYKVVPLRRDIDEGV